MTKLIVRQPSLVNQFTSPSQIESESALYTISYKHILEVETNYESKENTEQGV